jgi:hypothetical protein
LLLLFNLIIAQVHDLESFRSQCLFFGIGDFIDAWQLIHEILLELAEVLCGNDHQSTAWSGSGSDTGGCACDAGGFRGASVLDSAWSLIYRRLDGAHDASFGFS